MYVPNVPNVPIEDEDQDEDLDEDLDDHEYAEVGVRREELTLEDQHRIVQINATRLNALVDAAVYMRNYMVEENRAIADAEEAIKTLTRDMAGRPVTESAEPVQNVVIDDAQGDEVRLGERLRAMGYHGTTVEQRRTIAFDASDRHLRIYGQRPKKIRVWTQGGPELINYYNLDTARQTLDAAIHAALRR
jgi:hypothetical protein